MDTLRDDEAMTLPESSHTLPDFKALLATALAVSAQLSERAWQGLTQTGLPWLKAHVQQSVQLLHRFSVALSGRIGERPRRKQVPRSQAARAHLKNTRRGGRRTLVLAAFGLMGFFNIPLDADTLLIAPIIIGLAVDDTIHYLVRYNRVAEFTRAAVKKNPNNPKPNIR